MNDRQRFHEAMHFGNPDRPPYWEMGYWPQTVERWYREGMPEDVHVYRYLGFDRYAPVPINEDLMPMFREEIIEETDRYIVSRRYDGVITRALKQGTVQGIRLSMDQHIRFPVSDRKSWHEFKKRLNPKSPLRYPDYWEDYKRGVHDRDYPISITGGSLFGWPRNWMGFETATTMLYDDPNLMHEIMDYITYYMIELITPALEQIGDIDYGVFWEDMCFKTASMISPKHFKEFMVPRYKQITDLMHKHGIDVIMVDCDGYADQLIPLWLEVGINCIYPLEVAAGEDPVALRKQYGRDLLLWGGIDKRALTRDRKTIEQEIYSKVPFLVEQGGYIPGIDHGAPPDISYQNYLYYLELVRKICEKG